jgi:hypothetical protein
MSINAITIEGFYFQAIRNERKKMRLKRLELNIIYDVMSVYVHKTVNNKIDFVLPLEVSHRTKCK